MDKEFKTIDEQIEILVRRGLIIGNEDAAKDFLMYNNYYRVSGYSLTLRKNDVFYKNVTFQNIMDIYHFDHELRILLLSAIEKLEVAVKSVYSYKFTERFGGLGHLDSSHFTDDDTYNEIISKAEEQKNRRLSHEAFLKHFVNDLNQPIPLWAYFYHFRFIKAVRHI